MSGFEIIMDVAMKVLDKGRIPSFGGTIEGQFNVLSTPIKELVLLDKVYNNDLYAAYADFLANDLCYVEIPSTSYYNGHVKETYTKFLATTNIDIIRHWLYGEDVSKFEKKLQENVYNGGSEIFILKPSTDKAGIRKVTVPRKMLDLSEKGLNIIPYKVMFKIAERIVDIAKEGFCKVTYYKDNREERVLYTSFSQKELMGIFNNTQFVGELLEGSFNIDEFESTTSVERGYIRVPEVDNSIYDRTCLRSINLARVKSIEPVKKEDIDLTFTHVDVNSVVDSFCNLVATLNAQERNELVSWLKASRWGFDKRVTIVDISLWAKEKEMIHSTTFIKDLHSIMISLSHIFRGYTGDKEELPERIMEQEDNLTGISDLDDGFDYI